MRKIFVMCLAIVMVVACKSKSATATRLDRGTQVALKGNWTLSKVVFPGSDYIKINAFDLADSKCFVGSQWKFISNNNKGEFALNQGNCPAYSSPITWFINDEGKFVMKILDESKAKKVKEGYVLTVANVTDSSFELIDTANVGGKSVQVVYQFVRN
ncbi:lipocalin family protein [Flavobacterium stagni]|uniref:Uncharacterized protein n=1 Tax=Flavobacterium stagni TaxID=2506421 RepID=A0A4V1N2M9_9FLAO|nr:lipocalin family protein [Flavobacterium stagni]RXR22554.1 hypothetical protein EQG61_08200 [Flavobacterium stagni]